MAQTGFSRADSLRGGLRPERTAWDVHFYDLQLRVDPVLRRISGRNRMEMHITAPARRIQVDLFSQFEVQSILNEAGKKLRWERDGDALFIELARRYKPGEQASVTIEYNGAPQVARQPPWDGGFIWKTDPAGKPWVSVACQGLGASAWWPCKDHQSDEPDSMRIAITVPPGLMNISNGRLRSVQAAPDGWATWEWFVHHPINTYGVTLNIGDFAHIQDEYVGLDGQKLSLDYYVLPENREKAVAQFAQVRPMLLCFETHFGSYPFPLDGYKIVESPYAGMEHQSAIAYGNGFQNGYLGRSPSREGHWFDFILIHETAHEWFGNSVTAADIADMWIHEGFGTYMEYVFVECLYGTDAALRYALGQRGQILLDKPIVGTYGVHQEGSRDMYPKGAWVLHTLRHTVAQDSLWWATLYGLATTYRHKIVDYQTVVDYLSLHLRTDLGRFFQQYLQHTALPVLEVRWSREGAGSVLQYRWQADVPGFEMPVRIQVNDQEVMLRAGSEWKSLPLALIRRPEVGLDENWLAELRYFK